MNEITLTRRLRWLGGKLLSIWCGVSFYPKEFLSPNFATSILCVQ